MKTSPKKRKQLFEDIYDLLIESRWEEESKDEIRKFIKDKNVSWDGASCFYLRHESMGSFLNPPGDAEYKYSIIEERGGHAVGFYSLRAVINETWMPLKVRSLARAYVKSARNIIPDPLWVADVYNYFKHCYAPDDFDRSIEHMIVDPGNTLPVERNLAVMYIKEWFPDYPIRYEFLDGAPFGSWSKNG